MKKSKILGDGNTMIITDESGQEIKMEIVLTFDNEDETKKFVLFKEPDDEDGDVYAYSYDEEGNLDAVTDPDEMEMCAEVLGAFQEEEDGEEA